MNPLRDSSDGAPLHLNRRIDALCDEFEASLAGGDVPRLTAYLDQIPDEGRNRLLNELVAIACETLRRNGVDDPIAALVSMNPNLSEDLFKAVDEAADSGDANATALYEPSSPTGESPLTPRRKRSRGLHIRCPHCSNHVELIGDTPSDEVDCSTCGSRISLVDGSKETRMAEALQRFGRFELVSRLGVGGFGTVWKARDTKLDRAVAIKIPRHGQLSPDEMEQFFREARSVAQLRHPNIVPVHEVGSEGDAVFIVSDLIRGVSLADMLTGKQYTPKEAATLVITLVAGLEHAHRRGVIHRDLKPSNIMIDDDGTPYLMDFGLAKREADEVTMTTGGQVIGTPAYMSPEQADGRSAWVDRKTDVYSVGVILFELLSGELPFRGNAQMQVRSRLNDDAPNVRTLNRQLPIDLATICAKCLEREPGRRYQSAKEVGEELRRFLDKEPIQARPLSPIGRFARWVERRPLQAVTASLVVLLAVGGPAAAIMIEQERSKAQSLANRYDSLISKRIAEQADARDEAVRLQEQLDIEQGRANPWDLWPPNREMAPNRQAIESLLNSRRAVLLAPAKQETSDDRIQQAMRLLALAILQEGAKQNRSAVVTLTEAATVLASLLEKQRQDHHVALALADVYKRLSALSQDPEKASEWLTKSSSVLQPIVVSPRGDAKHAAAYLEVELRLAVKAGAASAANHLSRAGQTQERLPELWPTEPAAIYELACHLSGAAPHLTGAVETTGKKAKTAAP